jgi:hypothetical protein
VSTAGQAAERQAVGRHIIDITEGEYSMFTKRGVLDGSRKYTREYFITLCSDLINSGFSDIKILLPHNIEKLEESKITVEELLKRDRNYPALILIAKSKTKKETLKILFINRNSKSVFADDTFPNAQSEPPQIYFQSPDPGRTYAVYAFFQEYLKTASLFPFIFSLLISNLSLLILLLETIYFIVSSKGLLMHQGFTSGFWDIALCILALYFIFRFFASPKGLWIKPQRELRIFYLINMAIHGEYRDNPLVALIFSILGIVIGALIVNWLGLIK